MADIEKVIQGLSIHSDIGEGCHGCPYFDKDDPWGECSHDLCADALELLKGTDTVKYALETLKRHGWKDATEEQREMIEFAKIFMSDEVHETAKQFRQTIVRCKDCKHGEKSPTFRYYPNLTWCNKYERSHDDDWFCADGERK